MSIKIRQRLALFATLLAVVVITLGAYTRLKDAGLGCPDWPGCYGFLYVPHSAQDQQLAALRFPDSPIETHKGWPEMIHRYFASLLGLFILIQAASAFLVRRQQQKTPSDFSNLHASNLPSYWRLSLFLLLLVILQGLFGMWTVTLKLWPQVVSAHLLGGFTTLSLLFLLTLRLYASDKAPLKTPASMPMPPGFFYWTLLGLILVIVQIFLGAWTASNYAALACPDIPYCQNQWLPTMDFANGFNFLQSVGPNYLGGTLDNDARVAIHMTHRLGAILLTVYLSGLLFTLYRAASRTDGMKPLRMAIWWVLAALVLQIMLGISNVLWLFPLPIAVAHNAGGALLLVSVVYLNYRVYLLQNAGKSLNVSHEKGVL